MTTDPIDDSVMGQPHTWNRYAFVRGNPVIFTDPTGQAVCGGVCVAIGVGAAVSYFFGDDISDWWEGAQPRIENAFKNDEISRGTPALQEHLLGGSTFEESFAAESGDVLAEVGKRATEAAITRGAQAGINALQGGLASSARWARSRQNQPGQGLRNHFKKHGEAVGVNTARAYDASARRTVANGRQFTYRDRATNQPRVGYWDKESGLFTATGQTRKNPAILTHYPETWENLKQLPGFSN